MIKLYENIKRLRKENGWSQDDLAKRLGYTDRSSIAKIEAGAVDLSESKIMAFAKVFGVEPNYLMGWTDKEEPSLQLQLFSDTEAMQLYRRYMEAAPNIRAAVQALLGSDEQDP